jgi:glycerate 2-kinase
VKILVAPDKFKGSLSALQAARAMAEGARRAGATVALCPMSDGGDGFLEVTLHAVGGDLRHARVTGPSGGSIEAPWALLTDGTAVIESAAIVGRSLVSRPGGPSTRTTFGIGEVLRHALGAGARRIVVGLGGTSTSDGGIGMAQAIGVRFVGGGQPLTGADLEALQAIDAGDRDARFDAVDLLAVADVDNPLTGPSGAAPVYGPQKGADAAEVARLDAGLARLARLRGDAGAQPGDGAAGGLAYGLRVFAGARVTSGAAWILDAVRFDERLAGCDLVLTGEGRLDAQSARGKVVAAVARRCRARGVPVVAIAGSVPLDPEARAELGLDDAISLTGSGTSEAAAMESAATLLTQACERLVRAHVQRGEVVR